MENKSRINVGSFADLIQTDNQTITPLKKLNHFFYINSANRLSGSNTNFTYMLDIPYINDIENAVITYSIIPKFFYNVPNGYNKLILIENGTSVTISFPIGEYNRNSLKLKAIQLLNANSPNHYTYSITIPASTEPDTGKYTFSVVGNGVVQPILSFLNSNSIYEQLGFSKGTLNNFFQNTLISSNPIYLQGERTLFIHTDMVQNNNSNIIQEIYCASIPFSYNIVFSNSDIDKYMKPFKKKFSSIFTFNLTDENGVDIDLNGLEWNFTLLLY